MMKLSDFSVNDFNRIRDLFNSQMTRNLNRIRSTKNKNFNISWNDSLTIVIAQGCKNNCRSCCRTYSENDRMDIRVFNRLLDYANKNFHSVSITGGEPAEHLEMIAEQVKAYPDLRINMTTSGETISEDFIDLLKSSPTIFPLVSLNGIGKVHDQSRYPGSFDKAYDCIMQLISNHIPFGIVTVINRTNIDQIISSEFPEFVDRLGACTFETFQYYPLGNQENNFHKLMLTGEQIDQAIGFRNQLFHSNPYHFLFKAAQLPNKRCHREIQVNVNGAISYCPFSVWEFEKVSAEDSDAVLLEKINRYLDQWNNLVSESDSYCPLQSNTANYLNFFETNGTQHSKATGVYDRQSVTFKKYCEAAREAKVISGR